MRRRVVFVRSFRLADERDGLFALLDVLVNGDVAAFDAISTKRGAALASAHSLSMDSVREKMRFVVAVARGAG